MKLLKASGVMLTISLYIGLTYRLAFYLLDKHYPILCIMMLIVAIGTPAYYYIYLKDE